MTDITGALKTPVPQVSSIMLALGVESHLSVFTFRMKLAVKTSANLPRINFMFGPLRTLTNSG